MSEPCQHPRGVAQNASANGGVACQCLSCGAVKREHLFAPWGAPQPLTQASQFKLGKPTSRKP